MLGSEGAVVSRQEDRSIEQQVSDIYVALGLYEKTTASSLFAPPRFRHPQLKRVVKYYLIFPVVLVIVWSLVVVALGWPLEYVKLAFLLLLLVCYVVIPSIQVMEIYADRERIIQFFRNPNQIIFDGLQQTVEADCNLSRVLKKNAIIALKLAKHRISAQQSSIEIRLGSLVGALPKVGIVPGLITLVLAAASKQNEIITLTLALVVFVLYLVAFSVHFSLPRLSLYVELIQNEIDDKESVKP